jgi:anaerobic magnesium-protoporphyrin IX monomethyl ester cyclase
VLLTHSYHLYYDPKQVRKMQPYPPLGTLFAASVLRSHDISVAVFDPMLRDPITDFDAALRRHQPKIVAIYEDDFNFLSKMCLTRMRELAWKMASMAHSAGATAIAHGSDATDHAEQFLGHGFDFVLLGESEQSLSLLCEALLRGKATDHISGIMRSTSIARHVFPARVDFGILPSPAWDLLDLTEYRDRWTEAHGYFSINLAASRGCPYHCNWCAKPISGSKFKVRPPSLVADEMVYAKSILRADHIWFADDIFALNRAWTQQFANEVERRGCRIPFKIQARADLLTEETVNALCQAGCAEVWMGVESGSQSVLDAMEKGLDVAQVAAARDRLKQADIRACYFLQLGYPGENWRDIQKTVALVRSTRPDDIGVSVAYPLPNTTFYERVRSQLGRKTNWSDSDDLSVIFKGAYNTEFYRVVRDALHSEVNTWSGKTSPSHASALWDQVEALEPLSRNTDATVLDAVPFAVPSSGFVGLQQLLAGEGA